jgi:amino acid transporter
MPLRRQIAVDDGEVASQKPDVIIEDNIELRREINLPYAASIMTGIIIGSGIFVSPVSITQNCGSIGLSLIVWILSGILTLGIIMSYAELGALYPKAGGDYAFFKIILGPFPAFLNVWVQFVTVKPTFYAISALTTSNYLLTPFFPDCDIPPVAVKLLSLWILSKLYITTLNTGHSGTMCGNYCFPWYDSVRW